MQIKSPPPHPQQQNPKESELSGFDYGDDYSRLENIKIDESKTKQLEALHDKEYNGNKNFVSPNIYESTSSHKQNYIHPLEFRNISYNGRHYLDEVGEKALDARGKQSVINKTLFNREPNNIQYFEDNLETKLLETPVSIAALPIKDYAVNNGLYRFDRPWLHKYDDRSGTLSMDGRIPVYTSSEDGTFPLTPNSSSRGSHYNPRRDYITIDLDQANKSYISDESLKFNGYDNIEDFKSNLYEDLQHEAGHAINKVEVNGFPASYIVMSDPGATRTYGEKPSELANSMGIFKSETYGQTGKIIKSQKEYYEILNENTFIGKDGKRYWKDSKDPVTVESQRLINYINSNKKGFDGIIEDNNLWEQVVKTHKDKYNNIV